MKKYLTILVILIILATTFSAYAETDYQVDVDWGEQKEVVIKVNGEDIFFGYGEPTPYIDENGRTQVPIRFVSEALGCKVNWDGTERTVAIANEKDNIKLAIGKSVAEKNGKSVYFDTVPFIKENRTFVPIRFISEVFLDAKVEWDEKIKLVSINVDKELLIPSDFKKVREVLGKEKITINDEVLLYSNEMAPDNKNCNLYICKSIHEDDKFDLIIGIRDYDTKTLESAKLVLKVFYPTGFEKAHNNLLETVKGSIVVDKKTFEYQGIKNLYYDNRYYGSTKFEDATCIYVGKVGVKY